VLNLDSSRLTRPFPDTAIVWRCSKNLDLTPSFVRSSLPLLDMAPSRAHPLPPMGGSVHWISNPLFGSESWGSDGLFRDRTAC